MTITPARRREELIYAHAIDQMVARLQALIFRQMAILRPTHKRDIITDRISELDAELHRLTTANVLSTHPSFR